MQATIEIENIEEMRRVEGIEDDELRIEIRDLRVGHLIKLTLLVGHSTAETLLVKITRIRGLAFRGKLTSKPLSRSLSELDIGHALVFSSAHIHSIPKRTQGNIAEGRTVI